MYIHSNQMLHKNSIHFSFKDPHQDVKLLSSSECFPKSKCRHLLLSGVFSGVLFGVLFGVHSLSSSEAANITWTNPGEGSWTDSNNWDQGIPVASDNASIQNGGAAVINNGQSISTGNVSLGNATGTGTLFVNSGSLSTNGLDIGVNNTGTLIIDGGSVGSALYFNLSIGVGPSGNGIVEVNNGGSISSSQYLNVGTTGTGTLILNSGTVQAGYNYSVRIGEQEGSTGLIIINGGTLRGAIGEDNFVVGRSGVGTLEVNNNGLVTSSWMFVGGEYRGGSTPTSQGGTGNVTLNDKSRLENSAGIVIGGAGSSGTVTINDDATMQTNQTLYVGYGAKGTLILNGGKVTSQAATYVGVNNGSTGVLDIKDKGIVTSGSGLVGSGAGSIGSVRVSGKDSSWINNGTLAVGLQGNGRLEISAGGSVSNTESVIGYGANSTSSAIISGNGSIWTNTNGMTIGQGGSGTLTISDQAEVKASAFELAALAGSSGTLNIGAGASAGVLNTASINGGLGEAKLNFDHIDSIDFASQLTGSLTISHVNTGTTMLTSLNGYTGRTTVSSGILRAGIRGAFSASSDQVIQSSGTLDLNGFDQTVASLENSGALKLGGMPGTVMTVTGKYLGNNGTVYFNTALDNDSSATDLLIVGGDASGVSNVVVKNTGGLGAQTIEGIKIIDVTAASNATFTLLGDYNHNGAQAVVGGAYAYQLYQGNSSGSETDDWYLRSQLMEDEPDEPLYQGGVPTYEAYPQALLGLNGLNTLQQRVGNRFWAGTGNRVIAQGADAIQPYAAAEEAGTHVDGNGVWGRIEGAHNKIKPNLSTSQTDFNQNVFKMQAGIDGLLNEAENGTLLGGVFVQYVHGKTKTRSIHGNGEISTDGYGLGGTLTWYGNDGLYVDGQAQATWYRSDLSSNLANTGLISGNNGFGYAFSAETGKRFAINPEWSVTPQAQLVYSKVDFDGFNDVWGTSVSLDKGASLQGRLGLTLDQERSWQNANGLTNRSHIYGIANLYYEFLDGTRVDVAGTSFASKKDRVWGGAGLGGSYNWDNDKYSVYGEAIVNTSLNNFGDSYSVQGNVGFRVKW